MATDADTIRNADDLWKLAEAVRDLIRHDGSIDDRSPNYRDTDAKTLARLRRIADGCFE